MGLALQVWVQGGQGRKENNPGKGPEDRFGKTLGCSVCTESLKSKMRVTKEKHDLLIPVRNPLAFCHQGFPFEFYFSYRALAKNTA